MERLFAIHLDVIQVNSESPHLKVYLKSLIDLDLDLVAIIMPPPQPPEISLYTSH